MLLTIPTHYKNSAVKIGKAIGAIKEKSPDTSSDTKKSSQQTTSNKATTTTNATTPTVSSTTAASTGLTNYLNDPVYQSKKNLVEKAYNTAINKANTAYETDADILKRNYGSSVDELNRNKKTSEQTASVAREQLKRYLPTAIKVQGLGGLGVSETAALSAYNDYATNMAQISADYNAQKTSLDNSYNDSLLSLYTNKNNAVASADLEKAQSLAGLEQYLIEKQENDQNNAYNEAVNLIDSQYFNNSDELKNYLKSYEGRVNDTQLASLNQMANYYANSTTEKDKKATEEDEAKAKAAEKERKTVKVLKNVKYDSGWSDLDDPDNTATIDIAGNDSWLNLGEEVVVDETMKNAMDIAKVVDGKFFTYNGKVYVYRNGRVFEPEATAFNSGNMDKLYEAAFPN